MDRSDQFQQPFTTNTDEPSILNYLDGLRRRKWLVIGSVLCTLTLAVIVTWMMTPVYEAVTRIAIYREAPGDLNLKDAADRGSDDADYTVSLDTQAAILEGDALASEVIGQLHLEGNPAFIRKHSKFQLWPRRSQMGTRDSQQVLLLRTFQQGLTVVKVPHTRLLEIKFLSSDPDLASQVANTLANIYIDHTFRMRYDATMQASQWLGQQLADLQVKVDESEQKLVAYQRKYGILGVDDHQNIVNSTLTDLNKDLTEAEADRIRKEASYRLISANQPDVVGFEANVVLQNLRTEHSRLSVEYAQATSTLGPFHPKVVALKNQLKDLDSSIAGELSRIQGRITNEYRAAVHREEMLRTALEAQKERANRQNENSIEYDELKREAQSNRDLYDSLLKKVKEATVAAGLRSSTIRIEEPARPPLWPAKPRLAVNLGWALVLGLFGGVTLALVLEGLDNTIHTPGQAERISTLPALGVIPVNAGMSGFAEKRLWCNLPWHTTRSLQVLPRLVPDSQLLDSYRSLRSVLLLASHRRPPQVILFTSPLPQEGKTTTAVNAAVALAERGRRVLLIDADMRKPCVHDVMQVNAGAGLTAVLTENRNVLDLIVPAPDQSNLFVLPAGPVPPNPAQLLSGEAIGHLLELCRKHFDYIVIDTPPLLVVSDALDLSAKADAVLLVVRAMKTTKPALARSCELLSKIGAPAFGVVVNGVEQFRHANPYCYYDTV